MAIANTFVLGVLVSSVEVEHGGPRRWSTLYFDAQYLLSALCSLLFVISFEPKAKMSPRASAAATLLLSGESRVVALIELK
jgi:hypothetical protein